MKRDAFMATIDAFKAGGGRPEIETNAPIPQKSPGATLRRVRGAVNQAVSQAQSHRQHGREALARQALKDAEREVWHILSGRFGRARVLKHMHRIRRYMDRARQTAGADLFSARGM